MPGNGANGSKSGPVGLNRRVASALPRPQPVWPQKRHQKGLDYPRLRRNFHKNQARSKTKSPSSAEPKNQILTSIDVIYDAAIWQNLFKCGVVFTRLQAALLGLVVIGCKPSQETAVHGPASSMIVSNDPIQAALSVGLTNYVSRDINAAVSGLSNTLAILHGIEDSTNWVAPGIKMTTIGITHGRLALCYEFLENSPLQMTNMHLATYYFKRGAEMNGVSNPVITAHKVREWVNTIDKRLNPGWKVASH